MGRGREPSSASQQAGCVRWHFSPPSGMLPNQVDPGVSTSSSRGWAMLQRSSVPWSCAPLFLSSSSPPSPSVVSVQCFSAKPASTCMRRLAHSSPKSPLSYGIDVSRVPAVKQWRLSLAGSAKPHERVCLPGQVSNIPHRAGTGTLHQPGCLHLDTRPNLIPSRGQVMPRQPTGLGGPPVHAQQDPPGQGHPCPAQGWEEAEPWRWLLVAPAHVKG